MYVSGYSEASVMMFLSAKQMGMITTVPTRTDGTGAHLYSNIVFFKRGWWKVKVPLRHWTILIPIKLD